MTRARTLLWDGLACAALVVALFALSASYLGATFSSVIPGGWDGVAHYAIADLYAKRLFPALSGWLPQYFAGMPFPDLYPPLFYLLVGLGTKLGATTSTAFFAVDAGATAAVPVLTYACGRRLFDRRGPALLAGLASVAYLVADDDFAKNGIALRGTFEVGLASHTLGFAAVLLACVLLLDADKSRVSAALAGVLLGAVPLANVHVVPAALVLFAALALAALHHAGAGAPRVTILVRYAWIGLSALLVCAVWVFPLLAATPFVVTQSLQAPPLVDLARAMAGPLVCVLVALVFALRKGDGRVVAFGASFFFIVVFAVASPHLFPNASVQPARIIVGAFFLGVLPAAYCATVPRSVAGRVVAAFVCGAVLLYGVRPVRATDAVVRQTQWEEYQPVLAALDGRTDGRVLVESGVDSISDRFALQALVGQSGSLSLTTVFREASISALFTVPLRNAFSSDGESFGGTDSKLPSPMDADEPPDRTMARLSTFDVKYFAVRSEVAKARVAALPGARRMTPAGPWELYGLDPGAGGRGETGAGYAVVPPFEPVLTFAPYSVKRRPEFGFDFIRLGEEAFSEGRADLTFALARTGRLDAEDFAPFQIALVTEYRYADLDRAFAKLDDFSREHPLVLLSDGDPLFDRLAALARVRPNIRVIVRAVRSARGAAASAVAVSGAGGLTEGSVIADRAMTHRTCLVLFDALTDVRVPVPPAPGVASALLDGGRTVVRLRERPSAPTPILVRQTYWPSWQSRSGEPIYLASPTFDLLYAQDQTVELRDEPSLPSRIGGGCSVLGLASLAFGAFRRRRAPRGSPASLPAAFEPSGYDKPS